MRSKQLKLLCILTLCWFVGFSRAYAQDYNISALNIRIYHFTDEAKTAIEAAKDKENKTITVEKSCSQEEFAAICRLGWIRKLETTFNHEDINDLSPLVNLKGLRKLSIQAAKASKKAPFDLAPLSKLTDLVDIDFSNTRVTNTQALSALKNLRKVILKECAVDSIDFLKGSPEIRNLSLYGNNHTFKNYEPLLGLKKLRLLDISENQQATDELLAPLEALTSLQELKLSNNHNDKVTTLNFLKNNRNLKNIDVANCTNLTDISALKNMDLLEWIYISGSSISDISVFEGKRFLTILEISKTPVSDISALKNCITLKRLNISETKVSDISCLDECDVLQNLERLIIHKTPIQDISVLINCDKLTSVTISETIPQEQLDILRSVFPDILF